jgi:RNA polymerase sigma-32 factor
VYTLSAFSYRKGIYNLSKIRSKKQPNEAQVASQETEPLEVLEGEVLPSDPAGGEENEEENLPEVIDLSEESDGEVVEVEPHGETASGSLVPYSALDAYLAEIRRLSPLSREEEHAVAVEYHNTKSPEAAKKLVFGSLWLVVKIARDYEKVARNVLDLIQEGNIGLMEAVQNFDPYRGVRFPSYAVWWIRAYIIRYIIANWRLVKIGTTQAQRKLFFNLKKESERLEREGIYPSPKLLADRLNVREGDVVEMSQRLGGPDVSVDAPLQDESDSNLLSLLPSGEQSAEEAMAKKELHHALKEAIVAFQAKLNPKEARIFQGRVMDEDRLTLQDLSDELSISKERVRQIENRLREKLKDFVSNRLGSELNEWVSPREVD